MVSGRWSLWKYGIYREVGSIERWFLRGGLYGGMVSIERWALERWFLGGGLYGGMVSIER